MLEESPAASLCEHDETSVDSLLCRIATSFLRATRQSSGADRILISNLSLLLLPPRVFSRFSRTAIREWRDQSMEERPGRGDPWEFYPWMDRIKDESPSPGPPENDESLYLLLCDEEIERKKKKMFDVNVKAKEKREFQIVNTVTDNVSCYQTKYREHFSFSWKLIHD